MTLLFIEHIHDTLLRLLDLIQRIIALLRDLLQQGDLLVDILLHVGL